MNENIWVNWIPHCCRWEVQLPWFFLIFHSVCVWPVRIDSSLLHWRWQRWSERSQAVPFIWKKKTYVLARSTYLSSGPSAAIFDWVLHKLEHNFNKNLWVGGAEFFLQCQLLMWEGSKKWSSANEGNILNLLFFSFMYKT